MLVSLLLSPVALAQGADDFLVSQSAHHGLYVNVIADVSPVLDYVEVCWSDGVIRTDTHVGGGSTAGGNCAIGDSGFVVTLDSQGKFRWPGARALCATHGMRLPEVTEIMNLFPYVNIPANGLGWASNRLSVTGDPDVTFFVPIFNDVGEVGVGRVVNDLPVAAAVGSSPDHGSFQTFCVR